MRPISCLLLLLLLVISSFLSCKKNKEYFLRDATRDEIKMRVGGKWELKEVIIGFTQEHRSISPGEIYEFRFNNSNSSFDSLFYYVNDTLKKKSGITWNTYDDWIDNEGTLTVLSTSMIPYFCVGEVKGDNLRLFDPNLDGNVYYLSR